ncbi:MAG: transglutaminase family protein [Rhodospirillales bacterium]|nr:transglutaminase family protein [Rhodospirillales bacterium]
MSDPRTALEAIGKLPDGEIDIAEAALQFARVDAPEGDWRAARDLLGRIARDVAARAADVPGEDATARALALAAVLGGHYDLRGDPAGYDDPASANLIRVLERRRGLPVALGIVWLHAARVCGWSAHGLDFPAHFLLGLGAGRSQVVLDVFAGGLPLGAPELRRMLKSIEGEAAELRPDTLAPMSTRAVLMRLQNNLRLRRLQAGDLAGAIACAEDMLRAAPDQPLLWRDTGLMHQRAGALGAALRCLGQALDRMPPASPAAGRLRRAIEDLRLRLN